MHASAVVSDFKVNMQTCQVYLKIARYLKTINKKQDKYDQKVFRDKNFIQRSSVRSEKRTNFLRVRNQRNRIFHASAVVYLISRPENCAALRLKF